MVVDVVQLTFDYESLDSDIRAFVQEKAQSIHARLKRTAEDIIAIGQDLVEVKERLPHGRFIPWLHSEFDMSIDSAQDFMRVARRFGNKNWNFQHLPVSVLYELASPSVPSEVIVQVESGQIPATLPAIREAKQQAIAQPQKKLQQNANPHPILNTLTSKSNEWYTPARYVEAARELMGGIDLDPASNATANEVIRATVYYDITTNGLDKDWIGKVWLNPPYGRDEAGSNQDIWTQRLIDQYEAGITTEAVLLVNAAVDTKWFQRIFQYLKRDPHFLPVCFPNHRVNFYTQDLSASGSTHGSAFIYFGTQTRKFFTIFCQFGIVMRRMDFNGSEW